MLKTIVISGPISGIGQLSVKLKRNLAQKILLSFFLVVFQAKLPFIVELEGNIHVNVSVKHHLIFGFFLSFSPCNIKEIYKIERPVWQNRVSEICPFPLFFLGGFSAFYSTGKVSVILCPRCANMATASSSNKYNQLMEREKNRCHAHLLWLGEVASSFSLLV